MEQTFSETTSRTAIGGDATKSGNMVNTNSESTALPPATFIPGFIRQFSNTRINSGLSVGSNFCGLNEDALLEEENVHIATPSMFGREAFCIAGCDDYDTLRLDWSDDEGDDTAFEASVPAFENLLLQEESEEIAEGTEFCQLWGVRLRDVTFYPEVDVEGCGFGLAAVAGPSSAEAAVVPSMGRARSCPEYGRVAEPLGEPLRAGARHLMRYRSSLQIQRNWASEQ